MSHGQGQGERKGSQVVHVREDSGKQLEELFSSVMNPSKTNQTGQVPLRERKLPDSFWIPPGRQNFHVKQGSNDSTGGFPVNPQQPPSNLQIAHMRAHSSPATLQQTLSTLPQHQPVSHHARQHSCDALLDEGALPPGWDMAKMPDGQKYYINHLTQTTTWEDPRKSLSNNALNVAQSPSPQHQSPNVSMQNLGPLPHGWEQAATPEGDIYYINHIDRSTSWKDPRLDRNAQMCMRSNPVNPAQQQQQQQQQQQAQQTRVLPSSLQQGQPQPQPPPQSTHATLQFSKLQLEKERLRKRQEEIARQEMALRSQMQAQLQQQDIPSSQSIVISQANEMTSITDPFLGQSNSSEHSRQESGDSGVGGMGGNRDYSLPRTPEDFLSNVDEMDTQESGHRVNDFNTMDIGNIDGGDNSNMDSEDLIPSLQEDLSNELLNDMEKVLNSNKLEENLLTWL